MFTRALLACLLLAAPAGAAPGVAIHASFAGELVRDPVHLETLESELVRGLKGMPAAQGLSLDVSLVRLGVTSRGNKMVVKVEVRALLSDATGRVRFASTARATAKGSVKNRVLIEADAVKAATQQLARIVRAQRCT